MMSYQVMEKPALTDKVKRVKDSFFESEVRLSTERIRFVIEAYREAGGESSIITRAKVFDKYLRGMTLYIDENPIVGSLTQYPRGVNPYPEWSTNPMRMSRKTSFGQVSLNEEEVRHIEEAVAYFRDKTHASKVTSIFQTLTGVDRRDLNRHGILADSAGTPMGFCNPDYGKVLGKGLEGVIEEAEQAMARVAPDLHDDFSRLDFYHAVIITARAVIAWAQRYAILAEEMADKEIDAERKAELRRIAKTCRRVPAKPARDFREAIQSFWFIHAAAWIEAAEPGIAPGRFPQYMYPFYRKNIEEEGITREEVIELLELLFIKFSEVGIFVGVLMGTGAQLHTGQTIALGGFTRDGQDASNEIDFLVLEADSRVRMLQPSTVVIWHNRLSHEFLMKCAEVVRVGLGKPCFINGHIAVERHLDRWKDCSLEEAYDFAVVGCVQTGPVHAIDSAWGALINFPKLLEMTLNNGIDPISGKQLGLQTGKVEDFQTYAELNAALKKQLAYFAELGRKASCIAENVDAAFLPTPFAASLTDECLKRGKDILAGGAKFGSDADCLVGVVDVANSMAAIKRLVFEEEKITIKDLLEALRVNFEGYEALHHLLLSAPKYGNQDDCVDRIVREFYDEFMKEELTYKSHLGKADGRPHGVVVAIHSWYGGLVGALPSGRKKGVTLTDGTTSATPGTDRNGPTALIHSGVVAMNPVKYSSNIFNLKFHPSALANNESLEKLLALIKTYMELGGNHIQFNVVDAQTLREAQSHPDQYKTLVVRVAGYSAFFVNLDPNVQKELIDRTELRFA
ncbi:MAG: pyruvate formate lyase family protein [Dehalococcoidia bacterium]|nr:pyruvate formate lyase family protein [Dehalococcoidia bacterium]